MAEDTCPGSLAPGTTLNVPAPDVTYNSGARGQREGGACYMAGCRGEEPWLSGLHPLAACPEQPPGFPSFHLCLLIRENSFPEGAAEDRKGSL